MRPTSQNGDYMVIPIDEIRQSDDHFIQERNLWYVDLSHVLDGLAHRHLSSSVVRYAREHKLPQLICYATGIFVFYLAYGVVQEVIEYIITGKSTVVFTTDNSCVVAVNFSRRIMPTSRIDTRASERLLVCFFGIFFIYLLFGLCQEKINRGDYDGERFTFPQALVFFQCVVNTIFAKLVSRYITKPGVDSTPTFLYASCSVCYMGAMVASNQALQYINYPTQVLGKSCKPIPVMILGVLLAKKKYPLTKYLCVFMIVLGVASFLYKDKKGADADSGFGYGEFLLIVSLILDGLTGVTQENMRAKHTTNQHHMMYNVNLWSTILLTAALSVNGQGLECALFIYRHPRVISHLAMFSLTSAFGQHFIFLTVVYFGPLTCSIITTTRKFFTILGSVIIFQNPLTGLQWFGALLVFTGLGLDSKFGKEVKKASPSVKVEPKS